MVREDHPGEAVGVQSASFATTHWRVRCGPSARRNHPGRSRAEAKSGFVLLPRRRVVECMFAWTAGFRRLARDNERLAQTLAGYHGLAVAMLMRKRVFAKSA